MREDIHQSLFFKANPVRRGDTKIRSFSRANISALFASWSSFDSAFK